MDLLWDRISSKYYKTVQAFSYFDLNQVSLLYIIYLFAHNAHITNISLKHHYRMERYLSMSLALAVKT